jgi:hypothetical protein
MIAFVVLCLTSDPLVCEQPHHIPFEGTELACMATVQQLIVPYVRPGFTVARFGCRRME